MIAFFRQTVRDPPKTSFPPDPERLIMTTHVNELLDIDQVAEELHAPRLAVLRLIARSVLPANRLGESSSVFRVTTEDLLDYIAQNCPDLELPEIDAQRGWFAWQPAGRPNAVAHEMIELAVDDQRVTDEYLAAWRDANHGATVLRVKLRPTPPMQKIWAAPLPTPLVKIKGRAPRRRIVSTKGGEILATGLLDAISRGIGRQPIRATTTARTKIERLYETRAIYEELTQTAMRELLDADIGTLGETRVVGILRSEIKVIYHLPYATFVMAPELKRLLRSLL